MNFLYVIILVKFKVCRIARIAIICFGQCIIRKIQLSPLVVAASFTCNAICIYPLISCCIILCNLECSRKRIDSVIVDICLVDFRISRCRDITTGIAHLHYIIIACGRAAAIILIKGGCIRESKCV